MNQLKCEMCGSTDLIKDGGVFVCQNCGCKYSVEEARKMMVEGVVEVVGTVKVDDTHKIENYFSLAERALGADNEAEAEDYCNRILEIDPDNYKAWLMKGKAVGWQSTLGRPRIQEAIRYFSHALQAVPEGIDVEDIREQVGTEATTLCIAMIKAACQNYANNGSVESATSLNKYLMEARDCLMKLLLECEVDDLSSFTKPVATAINNACVNAWKEHIHRDYSSEDHPTKYDFDRYLAQGDAVLLLLEFAIGLNDEDDSDDAIRYKSMIAIQRNLINAHSDKLTEYGWKTEYMLTDNAKNFRKAEINKWHAAIRKINPDYSFTREELFTQSEPEPKQSTSNDSNGGCWGCAIVIIIILVVLYVIGASH